MCSGDGGGGGGSDDDNDNDKYDEYSGGDAIDDCGGDDPNDVVGVDHSGRRRWYVHKWLVCECMCEVHNVRVFLHGICRGNGRCDLCGAAVGRDANRVLRSEEVDGSMRGEPCDVMSQC